MTLTDQQVLIANGYLQVTGAKPRPYDPHLDEIKSEYRKNSGALTVVKNFLYYGYLPSWDCLSALVTLDEIEYRFQMVVARHRHHIEAQLDISLY